MNETKNEPDDSHVTTADHEEHTDFTNLIREAALSVLPEAARGLGPHEAVNRALNYGEEFAAAFLQRKGQRWKNLCESKQKEHLAEPRGDTCVGCDKA